MTALSGPSGGAFKRALYISGAFHALLLLIIIINPSLPSSRKTGVLAYINLGSWGGGGGGGGNGGMRGPGGGSETITETPLPKQTLHDLTTLQNASKAAGPESIFPALPGGEIQARPDQARSR